MKKSEDVDCDEQSWRYCSLGNMFGLLKYGGNPLKMKFSVTLTAALVSRAWVPLTSILGPLDPLSWLPDRGKQKPSRWAGIQRDEGVSKRSNPLLHFPSTAGPEASQTVYDSLCKRIWTTLHGSLRLFTGCSSGYCCATLFFSISRLCFANLPSSKDQL